MEALALVQLTDRSRVRTAGADQRNAGDIGAHRIYIDRWIERSKTSFVEFDARVEKVLLLTRHDHTDVDELLALHTRHDAHDCVVIRAVIAHESPPRRRCVE